MIEEAKKHPGFVFRPGASVRDLCESGDRVTGLLLSTPDGEETLAADLVIGTDGRASLVRKRAGLELRLLKSPTTCSGSSFRCRRRWRAPIRSRSSLRVRTLFSPIGPGTDAGSSPGCFPRAAGAARANATGWPSARRCCRSPSASTCSLTARRSWAPRLLDVIVGRCPRWHAPGLLLLGDAAHPMSPIRAQGINMALRDAVVAANHLVPALRAGGEVGAALAAIQREREPEIAAAQTLQYREARGQRWARERPWLMKPMLALVPWMMRSDAIKGFIQKTWLRQQRPLRMGIADVRLCV